VKRETMQAKIIDEIKKRGGEVAIAGKYQVVGLYVVDVAKSGGKAVALLTASGWRQYSRRFGARRASLAYLGGRDDSGWWAVRVPGTVETVLGGLSWLRPAAVKAALAKGRRRVKRQGDVYFVLTGAPRNNFDALPGSHRLGLTDDWKDVVVLHGGHKPLILRGLGWRAYPQNAYQMGRSGRRGMGD